MKTAARLLVLTLVVGAIDAGSRDLRGPIDDRQGIIHELAGPSGPGHARLRRG